ncbi:multiple C2 and transmembrane domain-containing protein 1 [Hoplias malabaricus]|uniref:multiple C2 and transmembrane domain-containing protein 1-like n=1 Tax=Hoplias malabaricus TaxID=27720 RepID=UPI003461E388
MEEKPKDDSSSGGAKAQESTSYQRRMWRNFQEKTKPFLSPKLGSERRGTDASVKKETGLWMFKRKKKQALDRVFSSSQPNLSASPPASLTDKAEPSSVSISRPATATGAVSNKAELSVSAHGSPQLTVAHLALSQQQKSSSLGSACFEKLVVESAASSEDELSKNASDSVSV